MYPRVQKGEKTKEIEAGFYSFVVCVSDILAYDMVTAAPKKESKLKSTSLRRCWS